MHDAVWVFVEHLAGEFPDSSIELVCEGRRLAERLNGDIGILILGHRIEPLADKLSDYGADRAYIVDHEQLDAYHPERYADTIAGMASQHRPRILLFSATTLTEDLAPRTAARLRACLAPRCDKLEISDDGTLLQTRLTHQRKIHTTVTCSDAAIQMATFEPGAGKIRKASRKEDIERIYESYEALRKEASEAIHVSGFIKADPKTIPISDAELIVSGGKGVGSASGFGLIHDLAEAINGSVAGSRVAVDSQWIGRERQIGQSGQTVSPELMISCGVSGANAHTFGMRDTRSLIAVNKDKSAPIMKMADLAVVGDLHEVLPELIQQLKAIGNSNGENNG